MDVVDVAVRIQVRLPPDSGGWLVCHPSLGHDSAPEHGEAFVHRVARIAVDEPEVVLAGGDAVDTPAEHGVAKLMPFAVDWALSQEVLIVVKRVAIAEGGVFATDVH